MSREDRDAIPAEAAKAVEVLPLVEERLGVDKRDVVTGRVRVHTVTAVTDELVRQDLRGESVEVERVPVNRLVEPGEEPPGVRTEGNVTILPVLEEVLVVEKRLLLKEELRITRQATREVAEIAVTVRKQRAVVERLTSEGEPIAATPEQDP